MYDCVQTKTKGPAIQTASVQIPINTLRRRITGCATSLVLTPLLTLLLPLMLTPPAATPVNLIAVLLYALDIFAPVSVFLKNSIPYVDAFWIASALHASQ
jgi:hypothetical protein